MSTHQTTKRGKNAIPATLRGLPAKYQTSAFRVSAERRHNRLLDRLRLTYRHPGIGLYVGAGVQQSIGLPGWRELLGLLTIAVMAQPVDSYRRTDVDQESLRNQPSEGDVAEIRKAVAAYNRPSLIMARSIKSRMRSALPHEIASTLYWTGGPVSEYMFFEVIEASRRIRQSKDYPPIPSSDLIDALVSIICPRDGWGGVKAIVNYNYDDLLDLKLREGGIKSVTVTSGRQPARQGEVPCYHVHGVLPFWEYALQSRRTTIGNFIFSEDEYHDEYANPYKWSNVLQTSLLSSLSGLFVGLSLDDPDIRRLVDTTHRQFPRIQHFAILKRGRGMKARGRSRADTVANLFEDVETQSFAEMGIQVLWVDEYEQISNMIRYVGGLDQVPVKKRKTKRRR